MEVARTDYVGPQVGKQLRNDGILAVIYAIGIILVYVGFRFSPGVVIALVHDAIITLGFFLVSRHEFNLTSVTVIAGALALVLALASVPAKAEAAGNAQVPARTVPAHGAPGRVAPLKSARGTRALKSPVRRAPSRNRTSDLELPQLG